MYVAFACSGERGRARLMITRSKRTGLPSSTHAWPSAGIALGSPSCSSCVTARSDSRGSPSFLVQVLALYGLSGQAVRLASKHASKTPPKRRPTCRVMTKLPLLVLHREQEVVETGSLR